MILFLFIIGACFGSFANVVIFRYPHILGLFKKKKSISYLAYPDSFCPHCKKILNWSHNIPIFSFITLKGQCSFCEQPIAARYPLNEFLMGSFMVLSYFLYSPLTYHFYLLILFFFFSLILFWIDIDHFILPDFFNIGLILIGLAFNFNQGFVSLNSSALGLLIGYFSLWIIFYTHKKITQKDGMGYGDFKLMAAQGAWFGWTSLPHIFLYASIVGLIIFYFLQKTQGITKDDPIPFGPAIILAGLIHTLGLTWF